MKTFAMSAVIVLCASVPAAKAAPPFIRGHLDQHASSAERESQQIRNAIGSAFVTSRDYSNLMQDADQLLRATDAVHDAIHSGRSRSTLHSLVNNAQRQVSELRMCLSQCDFNYSSPGYRVLTPTGYISYPPTRHPGYIHVQNVQSMLNQLSQNLQELDTDLHPAPFVYVPSPIYSHW